MKEKLKDTLAALRAEIHHLAGDDIESKAKLEALITNLEQKLDSSDKESDHQDLKDALQDALTDFEVSHPRITGILNDIMMTLSNMGI